MFKIKWTQEKIELLQKYYPNSSWDFLFEVLDCNNKDIIVKMASKNKIRREINFYSNEDIEFLKNNYDKLSVNEISRILNKTPSSIMTKANKLNLTNREKWSEKEIELLKKVYGKYTNKKLSKDYFPNRTSNSIRTMANKLNIYKDKDKLVKWYDRSDLLKDLKQLANSLGRTPKLPELNLYGLPSEATFRRYFGSYFNACKLANLEINIYLFGEKRNIKESINGDICFSDAETIITDFFILNNIPYIKEAYYKDYIDDERCNTKRCDWLIENNIFVEYFGLPDKSYYYEKMQIKRDICKDNNIQLIELFESDLKTLDTIFEKFKK